MTRNCCHNMTYSLVCDLCVCLCRNRLGDWVCRWTATPTRTQTGPDDINIQLGTRTPQQPTLHLAATHIEWHHRPLLRQQSSNQTSKQTQRERERERGKETQREQRSTLTDHNDQVCCSYHFHSQWCRPDCDSEAIGAVRDNVGPV